MRVYDYVYMKLSADDIKLARGWLNRGVRAYKRRTKNDPAYTWVLMSGKHSRTKPYFTVRGFDEAGWAQYTLHVFETYTEFYDNGGQSFGWGFANATKMDFKRRVYIV
ncbi:hypothetical protein NMY22_g12266 [Coprinellus aureogranulatus]|nr:hypothetical protein NMY22_g12266 [Coprinellus aureogranulatus]